MRCLTRHQQIDRIFIFVRSHSAAVLRYMYVYKPMCCWLFRWDVPQDRFSDAPRSRSFERKKGAHRSAIALPKRSAIATTTAIITATHAAKSRLQMQSASSSAEQHTHPSQNARIRARLTWVSVAAKVGATSSFFCVSTVCRPRQDRMEKPHRATWFIKHNWARYKRRYRRCRRIVRYPHAAASSQVCFESLPSTSF